MIEQKDYLYYIENYYPIEYDVVGHSTTIQIINAVLESRQLEVITSQEGSNFGIAESLSLIALVVQIIKAILEIIEYFEKKKEEATIDTIKKEVLKNMSELEKEKVNTEDLNQLIKEILERERKI